MFWRCACSSWSRIIGALVVLWLLGFTVFHLGPLIHVVLVVALILFVLNLLEGRRTV